MRFASVYRSFEDVQAFREEIERLERDLPAIEGLQLPLLGDAQKAPGAEPPAGGERPKSRGAAEK